MNNIVTKNIYVNIIIGVLLVTASLLGYLLGWFEDYLPYVAGGILILLSIKQFYVGFKAVSGKYPTVIVVVEFLLVLALGVLLIYLQDHVGIFIGLIIYLRGLSYLLIDYTNSQPNRLLDYLLHIAYITFGSFLVYTTIDTDTFLVLFIAVLLLILGAIFLQAGLTKLVKKKEAEERFIKDQEEHLEHVLAQQEEQDVSEEQQDNIEDLKDQLEDCEEDKQDLTDEPEDVPEEDKHPIPSIQDLEAMTVADLRAMAKEHDLQGYSSLTKDKLILFLRDSLSK